MPTAHAATLAPVALDKQLAFRLSADDLAWLEREAERQRRELGKLATPSTVLRDLIAEKRAAEEREPTKRGRGR